MLIEARNGDGLDEAVIGDSAKRAKVHRPTPPAWQRLCERKRVDDDEQGYRRGSLIPVLVKLTVMSYW